MARRTRSALVVFGYAGPDPSPEARRRVVELANVIAKLSGLDVGLETLPTYEKVAQLLHKKQLDVAWLPPIPFIAVSRNGGAIALARQHLAGRSHYHSAIIVPATSEVRRLSRLVGLRAAWVDRHSASGFVIPRIQLAALGVDPRTAFSSQRFYGSHEAVVRAVAEGEADFGATYVRLDRRGAIVHGPWSSMPRYVRAIRTLTKFGEIPSDVVAARPDLDAVVRARIEAAFLGVAKDPRGRILIREIFGADELKRPDLPSYELLRKITRDAAAEGILDAEEEIEEEEIEELEDETSTARTVEVRAARRPIDEIVELGDPFRPSRRRR